jgi:sarcosine oxidase subunit gamma
VSDQSATPHKAGSNTGLALELTPHYFQAGRRGANVEPPGVTLELVAEEDRFNIEARRGKAAELIAAIGMAFGAAPIDGPRTEGAAGIDFVGIGPARWHVVSRGQGRAARRGALTEAARGLATMVDVSHGFVTFRLTGPKVVETLAKLVRIDLDPASFPPGASGSTELHGVTVQLRRARDGGAYECAAPRSFAGSLYHALTRAAEAYGLKVEAVAKRAPQERPRSAGPV